MVHAAPTAPTLPGIADIYSAEALYIRRHVEPLRDVRNTWSQKEIHPLTQLLRRSSRPLKVTPKRIGESNILFYQNGQPVGSVDHAVTSLVSHQARRACSSRNSLRAYLQASNLPVPEGRFFPVTQAQNAMDYLQYLNAPAIFRPIVGQVRGFSTGITTGDQPASAWENAAEACSSLPALQRQILVERLYPGVDLRIYTVGEEVAAAVVRVPFYAVGDGEATLQKLHERLLEEVGSNAYLEPHSAEQTQEFLARWGVSTSHVPGVGEIVPLSETCSAAPGGTITVDVTRSVTPELKKLAVDAMWAFPGLSATGVDLRVAAIDNPTGAVVTEVDPAADITEFRYPTYGQYRRVSMDIIRQMVRSTRR